MRCKAAVDGNAEMTRRGANVLVTHFAGGALPATDPGIDRDLCAGLCVGIRSRAFDHAGNFVAKCKRQSASRADVELFAVARVESSHPAYADRNGRRHSARSAPAPRSLAVEAHRPRFRTKARRRRSMIGGAFALRATYHTRVFACPAKIFAKATKPSTGISSARAVGSMPASREQRSGIDPQAFSGFAATSCDVGQRRLRSRVAAPSNCRRAVPAAA